MAENGKEYLVGTVRPTNRPEAGQELDLDTLIPEKIKFVYLTMNFTRRHGRRIQHVDAGL